MSQRLDELATKCTTLQGMISDMIDKHDATEEVKEQYRAEVQKVVATANLLYIEKDEKELELMYKYFVELAADLEPIKQTA